MRCANRLVEAYEIAEGRLPDESGDPSGAKAHDILNSVMYGLKPESFCKRSFYKSSDRKGGDYKINDEKSRGQKGFGHKSSFLPACCVLLIACWPAVCFAGKPKPCITTRDASKMINKDVCVSAHVYDVVQLSDGTRFLDVCPPTTPDAGCRFTIVSFAEDRDTVGNLGQYRDRTVEIRGVVRAMHGRAGIVLSHSRQFHGGPPRFRPNPLLLHGFNAEQDRPPVRDPNLHTYGHSRSFMNSRDQETRPTK